MREEHQSHLLVEPQMGRKRLDSLLHSLYPTTSRAYFQKLIASGLVLVNGMIAKKSYVPEVHDDIEIGFVLDQEFHLIPEPIPLDILYEDEQLIAVNKPSGMVVHPGHGNMTKTFANALLFYCKSLEINHPVRPGIIHRLDKETSGLLLAAKTASMHAHMSRLFAERQVQKRYIAICVGSPKTGLIDAPIGRHPIERKAMCVALEGGKSAQTKIEIIKTNGTLSVIACYPKTGRTHQIRVHLKHIGCPILGDELYGNSSVNRTYKAKRVLLHADSIAFEYPLEKRPFSCSAPLAEDMTEFIEKILSK